LFLFPDLISPRRLIGLEIRRITMSKFLMTALAALATGTLGMTATTGGAAEGAKTAACCCGDNCQCENCGCADGKCTACQCEGCACDGCRCGGDCCEKSDS